MIPIRHIADRYSPEMALFVLVCRVAFKKTTSAEIATFLNEHVIDWVLFFKIVATHQLRPIVYRVLSEVSEHVEPRFMNKLRQDAMNIASGNLMKLDEMLTLHGALNKAGIVNIPYKGVLLSQFLFNDFVTRETADIDILIKPTEFRQTYDVLLESGFRPGYFFDLRFADSLVKTENELLFVKDTTAGSIKVEIHWALAHTMLHVPVNVQQLFNNAENISLLDKMVQVMDAKDLFVILVAHHGVNDVWRSFRHVADLAAFVEKDGRLLESAEVTARLDRAGLNKTCSIGLQLSYDLLGAGTVSPVHATGDYKAILHKLLSVPALDRNKLSLENVRLQFMLRDSFADKLRLVFAYIKVAFTPNIRDAETLRLPHSMHFLYYFLKPFLFFARRK